jgi:hypothetical protein
MNISEVFQRLAADHPERQPGSVGAQTALDLIKEATATWEYKPSSKKTPLYHLSASIIVYVFLSILAIGLSFLHPVGGFLAETILFLLFFSELVHPILARVKPGEAENLLLTIPARSKETQRLIITSNITTDYFTARPLQLLNRVYLGLIYGVSFIILLLVAGNMGLHLPLLLYFAFAASVVVIILMLLAKDLGHPTGLVNCSILLELGAILLKARPSTTSVSLYFSGANSLNSGVLAIPKLLKQAPELSYVINLADYPDKRINLVTTDGLVLPQQSDPLLVEMLMEVAKEKTIPLQTIKLSEVSPAYGLKLKKLKVISITNPLQVPDADKNIRELLSGLIRKLDH